MTTPPPLKFKKLRGGSLDVERSNPFYKRATVSPFEGGGGDWGVEVTGLSEYDDEIDQTRNGFPTEDAARAAGVELLEAHYAEHASQIDWGQPETGKPREHWLYRPMR